MTKCSVCGGHGSTERNWNNSSLERFRSEIVKCDYCKGTGETKD